MMSWVENEVWDDINLLVEVTADVISTQLCSLRQPTHFVLPRHLASVRWVCFVVVVPALAVVGPVVQESAELPVGNFDCQNSWVLFGMHCSRSELSID